MYLNRTFRALFGLTAAILVPTVCLSLAAYVPAELTAVYYAVLGCAEVFIVVGTLMAFIR